jgi:hypothetical protein
MKVYPNQQLIFVGIDLNESTSMKPDDPIEKLIQN